MVTILVNITLAGDSSSSEYLLFKSETEALYARKMGDGWKGRERGQEGTDKESQVRTCSK
jgi:hypothetical protein